MVNENNINKYGKECYKMTYTLIQQYRGQELMIIKEVRAATRLNLSDTKIVIADIKSDEAAYRQYLFNETVVGAVDSVIL